MKKRKETYFLIFLIFLLFAINYSTIDDYLNKISFNIDKEDLNVKRVIDGDTLVVGNNTSVRLFGINSPEKGELFYEEAKIFLNDLVLNQTIFIESFGKDKYYRELGIIFFNEENINVKLVEEGLANVYLLKDKSYEKELREAWEECISNNRNLCEKSENKCAECIQLKDLDIIKGELLLYNKCDFSCDLTGWSIKDEGRKKFIFDETRLPGRNEIKITDKDFGKDYVWTLTGDSLFLRDDGNMLVLWVSY